MISKHNDIKYIYSSTVPMYDAEVPVLWVFPFYLLTFIVLHFIWHFHFVESDY